MQETPEESTNAQTEWLQKAHQTGEIYGGYIKVATTLSAKKVENRPMAPGRDKCVQWLVHMDRCLELSFAGETS
eukprot:4425648-Amphidinium_carterae.1